MQVVFLDRRRAELDENKYPKGVKVSAATGAILGHQALGRRAVQAAKIQTPIRRMVYKNVTFSDTIAAVRREIWLNQISFHVPAELR
jgi:hypothetical protein